MSDQLVGTWQLQSWVALDEHGNVEKPFGDHPTGVLVITSDGWLSAQLAASRRQDLAAGSNPLGEPAGQSAAFLTYVAYAGRYRTDGDRVTTTVQVSLIPDLVGSEQVRGIELDGDRLVLRAVPPPVPAAPGHSGQQVRSADDRSGEAPDPGGRANAIARAMRLHNEFVWRRAA
jgi:Lipocalin-like domain